MRDMRIGVFAASLSICSLLGCAAAKPKTPRMEWAESVKAQVGGEWIRRITESAKRNDPDGCLFSRVDRRTVLQFRVDRAGNILGVRLETSSGVPYIDQAALDAMTSLGRVSRTPPASLFGQVDEAALPFALTLLKSPTRCATPAGNAAR